MALVRDGRLQLALSEERLSRRKRASGFPYLALAACWSACDLDPADVDVVAVAGRFGRLVHRAGDAAYRASDPDRDVLGLSSTLMRTLEIGVSRVPGLRDLESFTSRGVLAGRLRRLGVRAPLVSVPHHDAHAHCARLVQPDDDAMLVTMDGYGDGLAGTFDAFAANREELPSPQHSVALVYGAVTRLLGFGEGDEGKVMGLAAAGDPNPLSGWSRKVIGFGRCDPRLGGRAQRQALLAHPREDVAAALQHRTEEVISGWIQARRGARTSLSAAGGLFANAALNGALSHAFTGFAAFPHMGDGGLPVGAAAAVAGPFAFGLPFLGPTYTRGEIEAAARAAGVTIEPHEHPEDALLDAIDAGEAAGRFVGRSEYGPRALGHRSILLRADSPERADALNKRLARDDLMPFAPLRRAGAGSPTMTVVVGADDILRDHCPAAVHIDGTARTQIADKAVDPGMWRLLERAEARGMPALINTSFNRHTEPIVETPAHAIELLAAGVVSVLQCDGYILRQRAEQ